MKPEGWQQIQLGDILDLSSGKRPESTDQGAIPVFGGNGPMGSTNTRLVDRPTIVIGRVGSPGTVHRTRGPAWISDNALYVSDLLVDVHLDFLQPLLEFADLKQYATTSSHPSLSQKRVFGVEVLWPPADERRGIAKILASVDRVVETTEALIARAKRIEKGVHERLMSRGIGHSAFQSTNVGTIPESWSVAKLGPLVDVLTGHPFSSDLFSDDPADGPPLVRIRNLADGTSETYYAGAYRDDFVLADGDLLVAMDGDFTVRRWPVGGALLNQRVCRVKPTDNAMLAKPFLLYLLAFHLPQIQRKIGGTTVKHLSVRHLRELRVALPPLAEQDRIASVLDTIRAFTRQEEEKLRSVNKLKHGLMQDLLTGCVRVPIT